MSLDGVSSLVRSCALLLLGAAALVFALRGVTPAFAQAPPPGAVCATFPEVAGAGTLTPARMLPGMARWIDGRKAEGRDEFLVVPVDIVGLVCAW